MPCLRRTLLLFGVAFLLSLFLASALPLVATAAEQVEVTRLPSQKPSEVLSLLPSVPKTAPGTLPHLVPFTRQDLPHWDRKHRIAVQAAQALDKTLAVITAHQKKRKGVLRLPQLSAELGTLQILNRANEAVYLRNEAVDVALKELLEHAEELHRLSILRKNSPLQQKEFMRSAYALPKRIAGYKREANIFSFAMEKEELDLLARHRKNGYAERQRRVLWAVKWALNAANNNELEAWPAHMALLKKTITSLEAYASGQPDLTREINFPLLVADFLPFYDAMPAVASGAKASKKVLQTKADELFYKAQLTRPYDINEAVLTAEPTLPLAPPALRKKQAAALARVHKAATPFFSFGKNYEAMPRLRYELPPNPGLKNASLELAKAVPALEAMSAAKPKKGAPQKLTPGAAVLSSAQEIRSTAAALRLLYQKSGYTKDISAEDIKLRTKLGKAISRFQEALSLLPGSQS